MEDFNTNHLFGSNPSFNLELSDQANSSNYVGTSGSMIAIPEHVLDTSQSVMSIPPVQDDIYKTRTIPPVHQDDIYKTQTIPPVHQDDSYKTQTSNIDSSPTSKSKLGKQKASSRIRTYASLFSNSNQSNHRVSSPYSRPLNALKTAETSNIMNRKLISSDLHRKEESNNMNSETQTAGQSSIPKVRKTFQMEASNLMQSFSAMKPVPQSKVERYKKTADVLKSSGLMEVTMKTADLLSRNTSLQQELDSLKKEWMSLFTNIMNNSENKHLVNQQPQE